MITGLSPINIRLAYKYLCLGVGRHAIDNPLYDEVEVKEIEQLNKLSGGHLGIDYGSILRVSFYKNERQIRWIDFSVIASGAGGAPVMRLVQKDEE